MKLSDFNLTFHDVASAYICPRRIILNQFGINDSKKTKSDSKNYPEAALLKLVRYAAASIEKPHDAVEKVLDNNNWPNRDWVFNELYPTRQSVIEKAVAVTSSIQKQLPLIIDSYHPICDVDLLDMSVVMGGWGIEPKGRCDYYCPQRKITFDVVIGHLTTRQAILFGVIGAAFEHAGGAPPEVAIAVNIKDGHAIIQTTAWDMRSLIDEAKSFMEWFEGQLVNFKDSNSSLPPGNVRSTCGNCRHFGTRECLASSTLLPDIGRSL